MSTRARFSWGITDKFELAGCKTGRVEASKPKKENTMSPENAVEWEETEVVGTLARADCHLDVDIRIVRETNGRMNIEGKLPDTYHHRHGWTLLGYNQYKWNSVQVVQTDCTEADLLQVLLDTLRHA